MENMPWFHDSSVKVELLEKKTTKQKELQTQTSSGLKGFNVRSTSFLSMLSVLYLLAHKNACCKQMFTLIKSFKIPFCFSKSVNIADISLRGSQCVCRWEVGHLSDFSVRLLSQSEWQLESHSNLLLQNKHNIYFDDSANRLGIELSCLLIQISFKGVRKKKSWNI